MMSVRRGYVWLKRWRRCRGFGIQSPTDYQFVRYVVNEHWPYYAYEELRRQHPELGSDERRICQLALRISNWRQPRQAVVCGKSLRARAIYIRYGCRQCNVVATTDEAQHIDLLWTTAESSDASHTIESALDKADANTIIVVEGIYSNHDTKALWQRLVADKRTGITMDLYWAGIVFLDTERYKQHYTINF